MLSWAERFEAQRIQSTIMTSITEAKEFDKLKIVKNIYKDHTRRSTQTKMPAKHTCRYCGSNHPPRQCQAYGERCTEFSKIGHFRVVCIIGTARSVNEVEQQTAQDSAKNSIDSVNINSIHSSTNHSVITVKFKMSAGINNVIVPYKIDTGSDGNIMSLHIYKIYFLK